jgi:hypothetical protein
MRMLPISQEKRLKMIEGALEAKAPRTYRQLKMQGKAKLEQFLKDHDEAMMESYNPEEVIIQAQKAGQEAKDGLKTIRDVNAALNRYTEEVLATWLEFNDPPTTGLPQES